MNTALSTSDASTLLAVIQLKYQLLQDPTLSIEKHHLVSEIADEMNLDHISVANALAYYEARHHCRCWIDLDASNTHLLVISTVGNKKIYLSIADVVRLTPPIHTSPREGA